MSLRKRQAINSDGGNYRNYSKPGILWSTIDKNSVVAGTTPKATGQVTGLSFQTHMVDGTDYTLAAGNKASVWVSDAGATASDDVHNNTSNPYVADPDKTSVTTGASGLVFSTRCKVAPGNAVDKGTIIDFQYNIVKMGSGYKVGDFIIVKESSLGASGNNLVKVTVTSVSNQRS